MKPNSTMLKQDWESALSKIWENAENFEEILNFGLEHNFISSSDIIHASDIYKDPNKECDEEEVKEVMKSLDIYDLMSIIKDEYSVGEIIGVSQPKYNGTLDLKVRIGNSVEEFNNLPSINNVVTYNGGKLVISETRQGIQTEVESLLHNSRQILNNIDTYKQNIVDCEEILKELNPQFAKDKERDDRLLNLENRFDGVESKLDKIFDLIKK